MVILKGVTRLHLFCVVKDCDFSVKEWIDNFDTNQLKMCPKCLGKGEMSYLKWEYVVRRKEYVRY